ncbi:NACHT domain-containing protein [Prauserella muralis]|uniref:NACHT domain-containing protein n=1 Tax=Prauserella muralis TaxID=588067 RepID=UPI0011AD9EA3|nr:NACHT domain-containing protein [Prauserella muralis]TWE29972.1 NACHT domain-containing protein [Prauserella muralis]
MEAAALRLGGAVASHAARSWLQRRRDRFNRSATLGELAEAELGSPLQRRKLDNLVERIGHQVTEQLEPVIAERFAALPDNEATAAVLAVVDTLADADLSDEALLAADADPEVLARRLREQFPLRPASAALAEASWPLFELALDLACRHLVQVVRHLPSFAPRALAEALGRLSRQTEQLDELLSRVPTTSLYAPEGTDHDAEFRAEYLRLLAATLDRLKLVGLPADEQPRLALTVTYLSLSVSTGAGTGSRPRQDEWFEQLAEQGRAEGVPVESALGGADRILLRGDAGSGKTTLLNWLAVTAARRGFSGALAGWNGSVPFPIRLRGLAEGPLPGPEDFVAHAAKPLAGAMPRGWAHRVLTSGRALVLVDGVDEVPAARRRDVKAWLRELVTAFPETRVVVTARTAAADHGWLAEERFTTATLEPLSPSGVLAFVARWHEAAAAGGATGTDAAERRLRGQLERPHLRELAASPLLCALLSALNLAHHSELPRNRMDLYARALTMLLHLRDAERGITGPLADPEKRVLLRDLAWRLTLANRIELTRDDALGHVERKLPAMPTVDAEPDTVLDHLLERSGVLREPVPGRVDFVHRTFQEYLAADEAVQQHHVGTLVAHAHLDTWWDTVVMACGHATARQAGELLTGLLDRADEERRHARRLRLVAAACLETVRDLDPEVHARIDAVIARHLVPPRSLRETASLAGVGHRILRYLPEDVRDLSQARAAACARTAALTGAAEALPLLARYARDRRTEVQAEVIEGWQYFDPERYADAVLADAPLISGTVYVRSRRCARHTSRLRHLQRSALLLYDEQIEDLRTLDGTPHLVFLDASCAATQVDVAPLARHATLSHVGLNGAERFTGLDALRELGGLQTLRLRPLSPWRDVGFLRALRTLRFVTLERTAQLPELNALADLPDLGRIALYDYSGRALANTTSLPDVTRVSLQHPADEQGLTAALSTFPNVADANLGFFSDPDLSLLAEWPVEDLLLRHSRITDLRPLARLPRLRKLFLSRVAGDPDLSPLADLHLDLRISRGDRYPGLDRLGPGVTVRYVD